MHKNRLEAFSDGVIAIIITIMVLELKRPPDVTFSALLAVLPHIAIYALSFIYVGIYWNNHHHMFQAVKGVSGAILWANLHLLFWLSLVPFTAAWMGEHYHSAWPVVAYGAVLLLTGAAYMILARLLVLHEGPHSVIARAFGSDLKTLLSLLAYLAAIAAAFFAPAVSLALYALVALAWLIPDRRIERAMGEA
ncbi:MAG TPA: TMEM175 family protein [Rhizomicrobium sp.]|nr:TMEM175 family protein [Rhizomicrobium sp.]